MTRQRRRKPHSWDPYTSEVQRFSIYPKLNIDSSDLKIGDVITLSINEVDEKGRGLANYRGRRVVVYNASLGSVVKARIVKVTQDAVYAEIIETISETNVDY